MKHGTDWGCGAGLTVSGIGLVAFTLACEVVGSSWRGVLGIASQCFWCLGACILPLLALAVPNWRAQTVACAAVVLCMVPLFPFVPESPRWLLSQARPCCSCFMRSCCSLSELNPSGPCLAHEVCRQQDCQASNLPCTACLQ